MKIVKISRKGGIEVTIEAPADKDMVVDQSALHQGILSIGEYGTSGYKIAAFKDWDEAWFGAEAHGYKIVDDMHGGK